MSYIVPNKMADWANNAARRVYIGQEVRRLGPERRVIETMHIKTGMASFGLAAVMLGMLAGPARAGPNLVLNGHFQTGDSADWTQSGAPGFAYVIGGNPHGNWALLGLGGSNGTLTQNITTTVGDTYKFSFLLGSEGLTSKDFDFSASFAGQTVLDTSKITDHDFTRFTYTVIATDTNSAVSFSVKDDYWGFVALTGIKVKDLGPSVLSAPEPSTLASAGIAAVFGLGFARWRRMRRAA